MVSIEEALDAVIKNTSKITSEVNCLLKRQETHFFLNMFFLLLTCLLSDNRQWTVMLFIYMRISPIQ